MAALRMPTTFEHVKEAREVGVNVGMRIDQRMTHAGLGAKGRKAIGITDGMVRISVGIEDVEDIVDDLDRALAAM